MSRLLQPILWASLISCSSGSFNDVTTSSKGAVEKPVSVDGKPSNPETHSPTPPSESPASTTGIVPPNKTSVPIDPVTIKMPSGAAIPVAVGGASLTCTPDNSVGMICHIGENSGIGFVPVSAYYATDMEKVWFQTTFLKLGDNRYSLALPDDLKNTPLNIAVMLVDAQNKSVSDLEFSKQNTIVNLVIDGSFEEQRGGGNTKDGLVRLIAPESQLEWKATRLLPMTDCPAHFEYINMVPDLALIPEGVQYLELSSRCLADTVDKFPIRASQALKLEVGHTYRVSYAVRKPTVNGVHTYQVELDGKTSGQHSPSTNWEYKAFLATATSPDAMLSFQEVGEGGGRGTQVDHVMVVDLTKLRNAP